MKNFVEKNINIYKIIKKKLKKKNIIKKLFLNMKKIITSLNDFDL